MPAIQFIKKRFGHSYLVWFQNSNSYILLEEPAWFVLSKTVKRYKAETIAKEFAIRYCNTLRDSQSFVRDIRLNIEEMNRADKAQPITEPCFDDLNNYDFIPYSIHHYRTGNKVIEFSFETAYLESFIRPLIQHFETTGDSNKMPFFELFTFEERIIFRYNGEVKGSWTRDETHLVKGLIFMFLVNVLHDKSDADWLMTVHASAITNGKKTILFSAPPGHGKTTIAALLQACGYHLISDDYVPIDRYAFNAYPFPIAMSVKEGSVALLSLLFPTLEERSINYITPEKKVRYMPSDHNPNIANDVFPVKEIVFIRYDSTVDFAWEKLDLACGLKLLLDQAWMAPMQGNAAIFFDRIIHVSFFQLTYSNNQKALDAITNLFDLP